MFDTLFWALYWIDVLSSIPKELFTGVFVGLIAWGAFVVFLDFDESSPRPTSIKRGFFGGFIPVVLFFLLFAFIPAKKTMYMMLAVKTTDHAVNSEVGQKLQRVLNEQIDEYLATFDKKKEKK